MDVRYKRSAVMGDQAMSDLVTQNDFDFKDDEEGGRAEFFEIFEVFASTATNLGWITSKIDDVLRITMTTEFGGHTLQVRINEDDASVDLSVVHRMTAVGVSESVLFQIINKCNGVGNVGTFYLKEGTIDLIWHFAIILGDLPGMTIAQTAHTLMHAHMGMKRLHEELLKTLSKGTYQISAFTFDTPVVGNA